MTRILLLAALAAAIPMAQAADTLQPRLGLWETTATVNGGKPDVDKACLAKPDLAMFASSGDKDDDADCRYTKGPQVTGKTWTAERNCMGVKSKAEIVLETPETVRATMSMTSAKGETTTIRIAGRWMAANCGKVK